MHLVTQRTQPVVETPSLSGLMFCLAIADADALSALARTGRGTIAIGAPYHMSDDDAYLIVPEDIGLELLDILRDGDLELLHETLRDGLLALGTMERGPTGMELVVDHCQSPRSALASGLAHAATIDMNESGTLQAINRLGHLQCTTLSALVDDDGLDNMLRKAEYVGPSWQLEARLAARLGHVEPTYVWSRHTSPDTVSVELALFSEDDEIVVMLRPLLIAL